jgi:hypothetical protein
MNMAGVGNRMIRQAQVRMRHSDGCQNEIGTPQKHNGDQAETHNTGVYMD